MEHLDITIDFETCSLKADAAVMQMSAVAWCRDAYAYEPVGGINAETSTPVSPFILRDKDDQLYTPMSKDGVSPVAEIFNESFDLREQVLLLNRCVDTDTIGWWKKQDENVRKGIVELMPNRADDVIYNFSSWITQLVNDLDVKSVCLWAQGTDFDIAILRSLTSQLNAKLPGIVYKNFRDARTYTQEVGSMLFLENPIESATNPNAVYDEIEKRFGKCPMLPESGAHDSLFDAIRTSWSVYQCMKAYWKA